MVMIEALACGTPVVATRCGSVPEIVDDRVTGFVRTTEAGLVDALHHVGEIDRALCRRSADERFTAARMVTEHLSLYRHLSRRDLQQARMRGRTSALRALRAPGTSTSRQLR
jgi:glycosyltransferase involved in cell wall biosynthesis